MGQFSEHLDLRWIGPKNGKVMWELLQPLTYEANSGEVITVPVGFNTDLATVPRVLWAWLPPDWKYSKAAVLHDYLLVTKLKPWDEANILFHEGMTDLRVNRIQNWLMYRAVCGWRWFKTLFL